MHFDSADMPTHGVIVGMTGSGSTSWRTSRPGLAEQLTEIDERWREAVAHVE